MFNAFRYENLNFQGFLCMKLHGVDNNPNISDNDLVINNKNKTVMISSLE